jgi:hypothetical protein
MNPDDTMLVRTSPAWKHKYYVIPHTGDMERSHTVETDSRVITTGTRVQEEKVGICAQ